MDDGLVGKVPPAFLWTTTASRWWGEVVSYYGPPPPLKLKEEEGEPALEVNQGPESPVMEVKVEPVELLVPMEPMALALVKLQVD